MSRGLQRDRIVQHALELADPEGLDAVSFRRLAADFGVTPMALYRHVADRDDLFAAMSDLVLAEIEVPVQADETGSGPFGRPPFRRDRLHPTRRSPPVLHEPLEPRLARADKRLVRLLTDGGFNEREGLVIIQRLSDAALGDVWSTEHAPSGLPALDAGLRQATPEDPRMFGIDLVLAGARALADERAAASTSPSPRPNTEAHRRRWPELVTSQSRAHRRSGPVTATWHPSTEQKGSPCAALSAQDARARR